ncbi:LytTR family DNA-binding domain-containing protein [Paraflavitalea sp. CAU 1676]|uniref:LytR/AlgR family response regulator transcription factor n=1 Tax=Paraflavitalea sp. CAU 1676 TaxID=3032598 RepID=UPI0023DA478F|nr:LytTR family DNA-binding domain-containing protein [Paraflavitalea sp. CAU 1676]MDF2190798.1 LytTR family DNA-binding domain-containing protein [Paraflavitalea sp. CAU 1676]
MSTLYRCLVVEDEPLAQNVLKKYIGDHPLLELAGVCHDAPAAQQWLARQQAGILFLDINLPTLSGISFLKSLSRPPLVIFTTAYPEYAVEGFELDAVDYLVKPFSFERFLKAVNKALEKIEKLELPAMGGSPFIFVKADKKVFKVNLADILFVEALDDYVRIVTNQGNYLVHDTMKGLQEELPALQFMRVHKSYIIARSKIVFIEGNYVRIADRDIPIGASYREEVFARLKI